MNHVASFCSRPRQSWPPVGFHSGRTTPISTCVEYVVYVLPVFSYLKISALHPFVELYMHEQRYCVSVNNSNALTSECWSDYDCYFFL